MAETNKQVSKNLKKSLKSKGKKLPHGYQVKSRSKKKKG